MRAAALLAVLSSAAAAQQEERVAVAVQATVRAAADYAVVTFRHEALDAESSAAALKSCRQTVARAFEAIKKRKISQGDLSTLDFSLTSIVDQQAHQAPRVIAYRASQSFQVVVKDLGHVADLAQAVLEAGVLEVVATEYRTSRAGALREHARKLALEDARDKARFLERALAKKLRLVALENVQLAFSDRPFGEGRRWESSSRAGLQSYMDQAGELTPWENGIPMPEGEKRLDAETPGTIRVTATATAYFAPVR